MRGVRYRRRKRKRPGRILEGCRGLESLTMADIDASGSQVLRRSGILHDLRVAGWRNREGVVRSDGRLRHGGLMTVSRPAGHRIIVRYHVSMLLEIAVSPAPSRIRNHQSATKTANSVIPYIVLHGRRSISLRDSKNNNWWSRGCRVQ